MFNFSSIFSSFAVDDIAVARDFYADTLGLDVVGNTSEEGVGMLSLRLDGTHVMIYQRPNNEPAKYTVLNFDVEDIKTAVEQLTAKGIEMIRYEGFHQDDLGISRGLGSGYGPDIAWFNDPAGNILAVLQSSISKD